MIQVAPSAKYREKYAMRRSIQCYNLEPLIRKWSLWHVPLRFSRQKTNQMLHLCVMDVDCHIFRVENGDACLKSLFQAAIDSI